MTLGQLILVLALGVGTTFNAFAQESKMTEAGIVHKVEIIELFVTSGTAIVRLDEQDYPNIKAVVHVIDEIELIKLQFNQLLKTKKINNELDAQTLVEPYFKDPDFMMRIKRAYMAKMQAKRYQLKSYPAAVINRGEGLVSGDVDMNFIVEFVNQKGLKK